MDIKTENSSKINWWLIIGILLIIILLIFFVCWFSSDSSCSECYKYQQPVSTKLSKRSKLSKLAKSESLTSHTNNSQKLINARKKGPLRICYINKRRGDIVPECPFDVYIFTFLIPKKSSDTSVQWKLVPDDGSIFDPRWFPNKLKDTIQKIKNNNPNAILLASIGGATGSQAIEKMPNQTESKQPSTDIAKDLYKSWKDDWLKYYNFDGIDLDYEGDKIDYFTWIQFFNKIKMLDQQLVSISPQMQAKGVGLWPQHKGLPGEENGLNPPPYINEYTDLDTTQQPSLDNISFGPSYNYFLSRELFLKKCEACRKDFPPKWNGIDSIDLINIQIYSGPIDPLGDEDGKINMKYFLIYLRGFLQYMNSICNGEAGDKNSSTIGCNSRPCVKSDIPMKNNYDWDSTDVELPSTTFIKKCKPQSGRDQSIDIKMTMEDIKNKVIIGISCQGDNNYQKNFAIDLINNSTGDDFKDFHTYINNYFGGVFIWESICDKQKICTIMNKFLPSPSPGPSPAKPPSPSPPPAKYVCDWTDGTCSPSPTGFWLTKEGCTGDPTRPPFTVNCRQPDCENCASPGFACDGCCEPVRRDDAGHPVHYVCKHTTEPDCVSPPGSPPTQPYIWCGSPSPGPSPAQCEDLFNKNLSKVLKKNNITFWCEELGKWKTI